MKENKNDLKVNVEIEKKIKVSLDTFADFQKNFASIFPKSLSEGSYIQNLSNMMKEISEQFSQNQFLISNNLSEVIGRASESARIIKESLEPQILQWQKWVNENSLIFENINNQWFDFNKKYKVAEIEAQETLQKYNWFISWNMPINFVYYIVRIGRRKGRQDKAINKLYYNFFSQDNWSFLNSLLYNWRNNSLFKSRYKIVKDCILFLQSSEKSINHANVILPTLIVVIDGFLSDYLDAKGIQYTCSYKDIIRKGKLQKLGRVSQFEKNISQSRSSYIDDIAKDIFFNILFQSSRKGIPLKSPLNFNRHKILHGENTYYGRKDYLIRSFLMIDFLVSLK